MIYETQGGRPMKKFFALVAALLLIATASPAAFAASSSSSKSASASAQMVKLVNRERQRYGRSALQVDAKLTKAAQAKANEMVAKRYLSYLTSAFEKNMEKKTNRDKTRHINNPKLTKNG